MDDFLCPHCRSGRLESGACSACGWSISIPAADRPRPPSAASIPTSASASALACWFLLPLAGGAINLVGPMVANGADSEFVGAVTTGGMAAQFSLLAIIGAVGPGRHALRLLATFGVAAGLYLVFLVGVSIGERSGPPSRDVGEFFLLLPALLLSAQAPLWLFRGLTARRMYLKASVGAAVPTGKTQFDIAQMMWATALVALAVTLARGALVIWSQEGARVPTTEWARLVMTCGVVAVLSGLVAIPCLAATMITKRPGGAVVLVLVYAVILTLVLMGILSAVLGPAPADFVVIFGLTSLATFGGILAGLAVIRNCGYTMFRD